MLCIPLNFGRSSCFVATDKRVLTEDGTEFTKITEGERLPGRPSAAQVSARVRQTQTAWINEGRLRLLRPVTHPRGARPGSRCVSGIARSVSSESSVRDGFLSVYSVCPDTRTILVIPCY